MSSRAYVRWPDTAMADPPDGGGIRSAGDGVYAPSGVFMTPTGVGLGPLHLGVPEKAVCNISSLTYLPGPEDDGDGILFFGIAGAGGAIGVTETDTEGPSMRRRQVLGLAAALGAAVLGTGVAAGQSDDENLVSLEIAEFVIDETSGPLEVRVLDVIDQVLPPTTEILVDADEARVGEIGDPSEGIVLDPETRGAVSVYLRDSRGRLDRLIAWAKGALDTNEEIVYARELDQPVSELEQGQFVTLSSHPALVEPVREAGPDGTELQIGSTEIPHNSADETGEIGSYGVFDGSLIYEVGSNPPASAQWELQTRLGILARTWNKVT